MSRAAWQRHDIRAALVASGFTATGGLLLVHALATPGGPIFRDVTATVGNVALIASLLLLLMVRRWSRAAVTRGSHG